MAIGKNSSKHEVTLKFALLTYFTILILPALGGMLYNVAGGGSPEPFIFLIAFAIFPLGLASVIHELIGSDFSRVVIVFSYLVYVALFILFCVVRNVPKFVVLCIVMAFIVATTTVGCAEILEGWSQTL